MALIETNGVTENLDRNHLLHWPSPTLSELPPSRMVTVLPAGATVNSTGTEIRLNFFAVGSTGPSTVAVARLLLTDSRTSFPPNSVSPTSHGVRSVPK